MWKRGVRLSQLQSAHWLGGKRVLDGTHLIMGNKDPHDLWASPKMPIVWAVVLFLQWQQMKKGLQSNPVVSVTFCGTITVPFLSCDITSFYFMKLQSLCYKFFLIFGLVWCFCCFLFVSGFCSGFVCLFYWTPKATIYFILSFTFLIRRQMLLFLIGSYLSKIILSAR